MSVSFVPLGIAFLVLLAAVVQHLGTVGMKGVAFVMTDRADPMPESGFSGRSRRALQNTLESSAMMVPPALLLVISGSETTLPLLAGSVYLAARVGFLFSYWFGVNKLRSVCWAIGMASTIAMMFAALQVITTQTVS